ncbi:LacI family transcriptional regulator [Actinorhabdospora filicis]|uniref:LacI family transcriptional regulator n=1 Tax=Actinorhabdospora filicis TaxID=1785913 RepID=A0A9W6SGY8_9ACTN|nr:LacI family DNA-binding transcriptional regulator [Actinorhabdospora filicis]GLZ75792.1 LacI family transcriptional regulator [Actinorhabdospora filicis]
MTGTPRRRASSVTISEVARHAGVSVSTVSYVLSGKRVISESTRQRVLAGIRALGYHPHAGARSLASNRSSLIALILPAHADAHTARFTTAVAAAVREFDYDVLLVPSSAGEDGVRRLAAGSIVDGLILMEPALVSVLRAVGMAGILIGHCADNPGVSCVDLDRTAAGAACADRLADLGHSVLALLGPVDSRTRSGFLEQARDRGATAVTVEWPEEPRALHDCVEALIEDDITGFAVEDESCARYMQAALGGQGDVVAVRSDESADALGGEAVRVLMAALEGKGGPGVTLLAP